MNTDALETFRKETMDEIPASYSPMFHLLFPSVTGILIAAFGLWLVKAPTWLELLVVPFIYVTSNAMEWRAHKHMLHERRAPMAILYDRHTPIHHRFFTTHSMAIRSRREFAFVLIPPYGVLVIAAAVAPIAALLFFLGQHGVVGRSVAGLFLATTVLYTVSYEWLHLSYHMPETSFVGRLWLVRVLKRHHATHHDPKLMQKWNFNVTVPLWDWVRGTTWRPEEPAPSENNEPAETS